jgi:hypothetical protein
MNAALHEAIGRVAVAYSSLDFMIVSFAGRLISPDQRIGQTIFGPMTMSRKIDMLRTLFTLLPSVDCDDSPDALASLAQWDVEPVLKAQVAELDRLLHRARVAGDTRNTIMHALTWIPGPQPQASVPTILKVRGPGLVAHEMPVSKVEELVEEIADVTREIGRFMNRHCRDHQPESWEPMLGRGTLWEVTVKMALSRYAKGPQPPKEQK